MSSDIAIQVECLSKCYPIYAQPRDRLKQFILPRLRSLVEMPPKQYFREFWALRDVSFEVKKGEAVGIIGRNGSGKSTLLQMICGTLNPTSGTIHTQGRIAALLELGSGFNPDFTGRENVYLNGSLLGLSRSQIDERFDAIAAFADIGEHLEQPIKTYSSGMLVRLAFAVQVQVEPDILIVDEALAVGDWLFQKRCFQRIEKLIADGTSLLFVSHDQESIRTLTHRAILLNRGVSVAWGAASEVVLEYRRLLHAEEAAHFTATTKHIVERQLPVTPLINRGALHPESESQSSVVTPRHEPRSSQLTFGEGEAEIERVEVLDKSGELCTVYYPGDEIRIRISCRVLAGINKLNVGIRLRNKEGVKIYSWGTLNQDMAHLNSGSSSPVFWRKEFLQGESFQVELIAPCDLGMNLYEVQAAVSYEETPDYLNQRMLHWCDEAAFFQVLVNRDEHFFGGVVDLRMQAAWS